MKNYILPGFLTGILCLLILFIPPILTKATEAPDHLKDLEFLESQKDHLRELTFVHHKTINGKVTVIDRNGVEDAIAWMEYKIYKYKQGEEVPIKYKFSTAFSCTDYNDWKVNFLLMKYYPENEK